MKPFLSIFYSLICFPLFALTPGPQPKLHGDLAIVICASNTPAYIEEWMKTPSEHPIVINRINRTKPNRTVYFAFLVTGVFSDKNGNYKFVVSIKIKNPSNTVIYEKKNYSKGTGKTPITPAFIMADPALDFLLEDSDPLGIYLIEAEVIDLNSNKQSKDSYKIELIRK